MRVLPRITAVGAVLVAAVGAVLVAAVGLALAGASPAAAHVSVTASSAAAGGWSVLSFRAPTESSTASTVALEIHLPTDVPFSSVQIRPVAGWTAQLRETELPAPVQDDDGNTVTSAVTEIVWTADDGGLGPGQFGVFEVSVGPLPESGTLFFPVLQRYSDGTEVGWVQQAADGQPEPEHPAPKITIDAAAATSASGHHSETVDVEEAAARSGLDGGLLFGLVGAALGVVAVLLAGVSLARTRR